MSGLVRSPTGRSVASADPAVRLVALAHEHLAAIERYGFAQAREALLRVAQLPELAALSPVQRVQFQAAVADYLTRMRTITNQAATELQWLVQRALQ